MHNPNKTKKKKVFEYVGKAKDLKISVERALKYAVICKN